MKDCEQKVKEKTIEILEDSQPKPLPKEVIKELKKLKVMARETGS